MSNLDELQIDKMLQSGLLVSVNSDDPGYNQAYIGQNYYLVASHFQLSVREII